MIVKYLYLDDEDIADTQSYANLLMSENTNLRIRVLNPVPFAKQVQYFKNNLWDGLILDLRLDQFENNGQRAEYRASTLTQELRTRATEGTIQSFPIVICSTDTKLKNSFEKIIAGQGLFDAKYLKSEEIIDDTKRVADELYALAKGYIDLKKLKGRKRVVSLVDFLSLTKTQTQLIDERLKEHFFGTNQTLPLYEYGLFILKELIIKQGPLINRDIVCARLGVNMESDGIDKLFVILNKFKYKGPFNEGWERWWWPLINSWWYSLKSGMPGLAVINATERITILNAILKLKLQPAKAIAKNYSSKFWTVCQHYKKPLDPFDGLLLDDGYEPYAWQDNSYISLKAGIDPKRKPNQLAISLTDKSRLEEYKKLSK